MQDLEFYAGSRVEQIVIITDEDSEDLKEGESGFHHCGKVVSAGGYPGSYNRLINLKSTVPVL